MNATKKTDAKNNWMNRMKNEADAAKRELQMNGMYFQGSPEQWVAFKFISSEPVDGVTKNGTPTNQFTVLRLDSGKEQSLGVPKSITALVDQLIAIAMRHGGNLADVKCKAHFSQGKKSVIMDTIVEEVA